MMMHLKIKFFQKTILDFYRDNKRNFSWRSEITPYKVFVSEIMLQQTQTFRVMPYFERWMTQFPNFDSLASASREQVLCAWQGLGYNRRAVALHVGAQKIINDFGGALPPDPIFLETFSGIGPNTAASICAFAFNMPVVFIETNIRTVFLHHFFKQQNQIKDQQILDLVAATLDNNNPRNWYYALMDHGVYLKKTLKVNNTASTQYKKQSMFVGSRRQVRGAIIRILTETKSISQDDLLELVQQQLPTNGHNVFEVLSNLVSEKLVQQDGKYCKL